VRKKYRQMKATGCSPPEAIREGPRCIAELPLCIVWDGGLVSGSFLHRKCI